MFAQVKTINREFKNVLKFLLNIKQQADYFMGAQCSVYEEIKDLCQRFSRYSL